MIAINTLLAHLTRPDVSEVCLTSGKKPGLRQGTTFHQTDDGPLSADDLLHMLFTAGGSRYVESLGPKPAQWRTRVEGVGAVIVSAVMNDDVIEARFILRDTTPGTPVLMGAPPGAAPGSAPNPPQAPPGAPFAAPKPPQAPPGAPFAAPKPPPPPQRAKTPSVPPAKLAAKRTSVRPQAAATDDTVAGRKTRPGRPLEPERAAPPPPPPPPPAREPDPYERPRQPRVPPPGFFEVPRTAPRAASEIDLELDVEIPSVPAADERAQPQRPPPLTIPEEHPMPPPDANVAYRAGRSTRPFGGEPPPELFRTLLRAARELGASDLHLVSGRPPLMRVGGQIVAHGDALDAALVKDMVLPRVPGRLDAILARDGSCDFAIEEGELGRYRINVSRQRTGLKASLRLVSLQVPTLQSLGLPLAIGAATHHHQGLIVLTGPTGHGKTTTLAAVVDILNAESARHVITVEDPIEYIHPRKRAMMSQREVGTHTRSFHSALKAALREDPDVIVIGELRDTETVRIALEASETGHLVLGTMSTPSASKAIDRLIDLFPPGDQQQVRMTLAGGLRLIVSQRLLPDAEGKGMVAAAELLPGILPLWNLIRDNRTYQIPSLQQRGRELGVIRLDDSLRELVKAGRVTAAAAIAVAEAPEELEQVLGQPGGHAGGPGGHVGGPPGPAGGPPRAAVRIPEPKPSAPGGPDTPREGAGAAKGIFDRVFKKGG